MLAILTRRDYVCEGLVDGEHVVQRKNGLFGEQLRGGGVLHRFKLDDLTFFST